MKLQDMDFEHYMQVTAALFFVMAFFLSLAFCTIVVEFPFALSFSQFLTLLAINGIFVLYIGVVFNKRCTKKLSNRILYWEATGLDEKRRTSLLKSISGFPLKKSIEIFFLLVFVGSSTYLGTGKFLHMDRSVVRLLIESYVFASYCLSIFYMIFLEKKCFGYSVRLVNQGIDSSVRTYFGLSFRHAFFLFIIFPLVLSTVYYFLLVRFGFVHQVVHQGGKIMTQTMSESELGGFFVKSSISRRLIQRRMFLFSIVNIFTMSYLFYAYFHRVNKYSSIMENSLVHLKNRKSGKEMLFPVDLASENSYSLYLINKAVLLFDRIINTNTHTSVSIEKSAQKLSEITKDTRLNVLEQSSNIEEILATMQSVSHLSEKSELKIDEALKVTSKTLDNVDVIFRNLSENATKIKNLTDANRMTTNNLSLLSSRILSIKEIVNLIDKVSEQTKTIAFNAELEANTIKVRKGSLKNVAEQIRNLTNTTNELTKDIRLKIRDIINSSKQLIEFGNTCMEKTYEANEICEILKKRFDSIRESSKLTSSNAEDVKVSIKVQTESLNEIVRAFSAITESVKKFGVKATDVFSTIEKLQENSSHILAINSQYNSSEEEEI